MWFAEDVKPEDSASTRWGKHYFTCDTCELAESLELAHLDVLCDEGKALRGATLSAIPDDVPGVEYLIHLADEYATEEYRRYAAGIRWER